MESGILTLRVADSYSPDRAGDAHRRLQAGGTGWAGARPCVGLLSLQDFARECDGLRIQMNQSLSLYESVLGSSYDRLPPAVSRFHRLVGRQSLTGWVQTELLAAEGLSPQGLQTLLLVDGTRAWQHTAAIFRVLHALGWPWRLAWVAWLLPAFLRDPAYRWLARNRYRLFGRSEVCLMPSPEHADRFLD